MLVPFDRGPMDIVEESRDELAVDDRPTTGVRVQAGTYFLELTSDWVVLRASDNIELLLRQPPTALIDQPLGRFVDAQALHDLRNLFSRLSGTLGITRAYAVQLTDEPMLIDVASQLEDARVLLEIIPSSGKFGECFGIVAGLMDGLSGCSGQQLLDNAARRMRGLTGYDRVSLTAGGRSAESSRGAIGTIGDVGHLPPIVTDCEAKGIRLVPENRGSSASAGLFRAPSAEQSAGLMNAGVRASLRVPFRSDGVSGEFLCLSRTARKPDFELQAAAELFAQLFAMRMEVDRLKARD